MENSGLALFVGGMVVTVFMVMGGMFNLRRHDMKAMKNIDAMTATGTRVWSYLTPQQQDELKSIESLLVQEEWIESNVSQEVLGGVSAERVLIEFANRGLIILGQGVFRRHSSPLDFIEPKAQFVEDIVVEPEDSEDSLSEQEAKEVVTEDELLILVTGDKCGQCGQLLKEPIEPETAEPTSSENEKK